MSDGSQRVLDHIRSISGTEAEKGRLFEQLMKAYFQKDPDPQRIRLVHSHFTTYQESSYMYSYTK